MHKSLESTLWLYDVIQSLNYQRLCANFCRYRSDSVIDKEEEGGGYCIRDWMYCQSVMVPRGTILINKCHNFPRVMIDRYCKSEPRSFLARNFIIIDITLRIQFSYSSITLRLFMLMRNEFLNL